jgi:anti-anti-sigma regulatory factor
VDPTDRPAVTTLIDAYGDVEARSCEYRLRDLAGVEHLATLAVANEGPGGTTGTAGFVVDVTRVREAAVSTRVNEQLGVALESHAVIDQAKGVLMLTYGVDDEAAFGMLRSSSQQLNVRLRDLAARIVAAVGEGLDAPARERVDAVVFGVADEDSTGRRPPATTPPLDLRTVLESGVPTLHVTGSVDLATKDDLASAVALLILRGRAVGQVAVDLRGVHRVGPVAAGVMASAFRRCADQGVAMVVIGGRTPSTAELAAPAAPLAGRRIT